MRRTAARIGVVAALALSMGVVTAVAPPARADEPTDGLISSPRANDDEMNYAINLAPGASASDLERAIGLVPSVKGVALASYPEIGTFFAQSATPSFAPDLAAALKDAGISVHSIGPTRTEGVLYYERVALPTNDEAPAVEENADTPAAGDPALTTLSRAAWPPCATRARAMRRMKRSSTGVQKLCTRARPGRSPWSARRSRSPSLTRVLRTRTRIWRAAWILSVR